MQTNTLSPRHYAQNWMKAKTKESKQKALEGCPERFKELVNTHVRISRDRVRAMDGAVSHDGKRTRSEKPV